MVSVLLAAWNGEAHLPAQLASLRAQRGVDLRVLWQDDGSTDGTRAILEAATQADGRLRPGEQQGQHLGAAGNFLSLMRQDDAPYTALCDQDDLWQPEKLRRCLEALQKAEAECGATTPLLVHHDCRVVDAEGKLLHPSLLRHQGWDGGATGLPRLLMQNNVTGCTCVMNAALRRLVAEHALPEKLFMHDWFIAQTAAAFGRIIYLDEPLVDYRQHGANALGASQAGLIGRAVKALRAPSAVRARFALSYRMARVLREAYGDALPPTAREAVEGFIAIEGMPWLQRQRAFRRGGYLMQNRLMRLGQWLLG